MYDNKKFHLKTSVKGQQHVFFTTNNIAYLYIIYIITVNYCIRVWTANNKGCVSDKQQNKFCTYGELL